VAGEPAAATLHTVPQGRRLAAVISHDVDGTRSVSNALRYAEFEREAGIRATYFIQTKYVRDWNDDVFFNQLLEQVLPGLRITSSRPGHLRSPYQLPEALDATGYRYSSSVTANNSLTHFPFRLTYSRETAAQSAIYEFPITIEDEAKPPLETRLAAALVLADKLARYGALMVVLIHTDVAEGKLEFERELVGERTLLLERITEAR
jgi:hypothetical protein